MLSTCKYTQMFCITFWLTLKQKVPEHFMRCTQHNRHDHLSTRMFCITSKQKVPEHSMQCAQRNRQDHLSLLMLECIMVLCVWLECWASCNSFYSHMTRMFCITGWAFGHLCIGVWGVGREKYILLLFFSYWRKKKVIFFPHIHTHPPILRCPKAQPDWGGPETDFLKTTCLHACGPETRPIASESPKLNVFFKICIF
jgi:hypothetical protein